jgi:hypothetical protein
MDRQPGIDEIVAFLETNSPSTIGTIRNKNTQYAKILKLGGALGYSDDIEELKVRAKVCAAAIEVAIGICDANISSIRGKLHSTQKIQLYGQLITTISGAGVLTTLATKHVIISYICGALSLLGALVPLVVDYYRKTLDQAKPLFDQFNSFVNLKIEVEKNKREIAFFLNDNFNTEKISQIINDTNSLCEKINKEGYFTVN